jgi:hypothetical protein
MGECLVIVDSTLIVSEYIFGHKPTHPCSIRVFGHGCAFGHGRVFGDSRFYPST